MDQEPNFSFLVQMFEVSTRRFFDCMSHSRGVQPRISRVREGERRPALGEGGDEVWWHAQLEELEIENERLRGAWPRLLERLNTPIAMMLRRYLMPGPRMPHPVHSARQPYSQHHRL
jgi:hypothetical protein